MYIFNKKPERVEGITVSYWWKNNRDYLSSVRIDLPKGTIQKLIGKDMTWKDDYYEYTEK